MFWMLGCMRHWANADSQQKETWSGPSAIVVLLRSVYRYHQKAQPLPQCACQGLGQTASWVAHASIRTPQLYLSPLPCYREVTAN